MQTPIIVQNALDQLAILTGIEAHWHNASVSPLDGKIAFTYNNKDYSANVEIKRELRQHQLPAIYRLHEQNSPFIIIAETIFPNIKEELRKQGIGYLETNGNMFVKIGDVFLWVDGKKAFHMEKSKAGRAFTKTGLKVLFHFLLNEDLINCTYREIAAKTGIGFGNINFIMSDLKEQGFLLPAIHDEYMLVKKKELLNKWIDNYAEKLKPEVFIDSFSFLREEDFIHWRAIHLKEGKTWWGSEPAAAILTNYLKPGELTMYTTESRTELIKNYRLYPDKSGKIKAYQKFWQDNEEKNNLEGPITPPLLIYADLINISDRRSLETAQKIYDDFLQNDFPADTAKS